MSIILKEKVIFKTAKLRKEHVQFIDYVRNIQELDNIALGLGFLLDNPLVIAPLLESYKSAKSDKKE